jgi:SRSO17 transposase
MMVASIEARLELWACSLRDVKARIRPLFSQQRVAFSPGQFLDGLLGNERRKTGWMRAEAAGDPGPWRQQAILDRGRWDADALRDIVRDYALETLVEQKMGEEEEDENTEEPLPDPGTLTGLPKKE